MYVLCRKRETLRLVAAALEREQIAHSAVEDTTLASTPEAQDLIAVLDAIVSPAHRLSLARALRSPLFGASDDDLLALSAAALAAGDRDWWRALAAMAAPSPALARARTLLRDWRAAAAALPPHDLLDRIVHEGELRERTVAVVPPEQRALALDAIDAVLAQALLLDGGRYATPYGFVRALKRRAVKSAPPVRADAVRLLTVHGAKGLEADTVFITDADPERPTTETTTLLVDWPVEAERPVRCAFVYSESRCPPSLVDLLARETEAREREEMNMLYVAMTRAKRRLVFSATEPFAPPPRPSWWQRVEPFVAALAPATAERGPAAARPHPPATLQVLPRRAARPETATFKPEVEPKVRAEVESKAEAKVQTKARAKASPPADLQLGLFSDAASRPEPEPQPRRPRLARPQDRGRRACRGARARGPPGARMGGPARSEHAARRRSPPPRRASSALLPARSRSMPRAILDHPAGARFFAGPQTRLERQRGRGQRRERGAADRPAGADRGGGRRAGLVGPRLQAAPCPRGARAVPAAVAALP